MSEVFNIIMENLLWENLSKELCPYCKSKLVLAGNKKGYHCEDQFNKKFGCKFFIREKRKQEIIGNLGLKLS